MCNLYRMTAIVDEMRKSSAASKAGHELSDREEVSPVHTRTREFGRSVGAAPTAPTRQHGGCRSHAALADFTISIY